MPLPVMLAALCATFVLSQSFRTVAAVMAGALQVDFAATPQQLGLFAAAFHLSFGLAQLFVGVALDLYGTRLTVAVAWLLVLIGVLVSALAPNLTVLIIGQFLIGVGCAPAFLATLVFVANAWPAERFASMSGVVLAIGGIGMLITGTPLAWVIEQGSWRIGFLVLGAASVAGWLAVILLVREPPRVAARRETIGEAFRRLGPILTERHTLGIVALGATTYASFIAVRGLWAVPLLVDRHQFSLVASGNVMLVVSLAALVGPLLFGLVTLANRPRRFAIIATTTVLIALAVALALPASAGFDIVVLILIGLASGGLIYQYADVRSAYGVEVQGRALAVFNMSVFLGVALMQWLTGVAASTAIRHDADPMMAAMATAALMLALSLVAFILLPWPRGTRADRSIDPEGGGAKQRR